MKTGDDIREIVDRLDRTLHDECRDGEFCPECEVKMAAGTYLRRHANCIDRRQNPSTIRSCVYCGRPMELSWPPGLLPTVRRIPEIVESLRGPGTATTIDEYVEVENP